MAKPVVFILGATGTIGKATIKHMSTDMFEIKAGTRNPDKVPDSMRLPGVTFVKCSVGDDHEDMKKALTGVDTLFIIPPTAESSADAVAGAACAAKNAGVKHVLLLSASSEELDPNYKYSPMKGSFIFNEKKVRSLFPHATIIWLPFFMENCLEFAPSVKASGKFQQPVGPEKLLPWMAGDDGGKAAATILSNPQKYEGKFYRLFNEMRSYREVAEAFTEVFGKKVEYDHVSYEDFENGMREHGLPEFMVRLYSNLFRLVDEENPIMLYGKTDHHKTITGQDPISFKEWCEQHTGNFN